MQKRFAFLFAWCLMGTTWTEATEPVVHSTRLRFEVTVSPELATALKPGRLIVILGRAGGFGRFEPRQGFGETGMDSPPGIGRDMPVIKPGEKVVVDQSNEIFPIEHLSKLPAGKYAVQAALRINPDWSSHNAPGNLYSAVVNVELDPAKDQAVPLVLSLQVPAEKMPADSDNVKYVKLKSTALSKFYGRPMFVRAGVVLPSGFAEEPNRKYPLRVHIGGFGSRFTGVRFLAIQAGRNPQAPKFVAVMLDGAGPLGDPYQVNSSCHGPFGDAIVNELIPHVEKTFRCVGANTARFTDGTSTGGWVSLALQILYPETFNGCWSSAPDPVDFRAYELVNIYRDKNVYVNRFGFDRPSKRTIEGETAFTLRHECQVENVLGFGDNWVTSGKDWCSWNGVFGPRGPNGRPIPLWNPKTGVIDPKVAEHYRKYDLRHILETNWKTLAPKLQGKIHVWVGDADDYFLNNAVHLLNQAVKRFDPPFDGSITIAPHQGHTSGWADSEVLEQMNRRFLAAHPVTGN